MTRNSDTSERAIQHVDIPVVIDPEQAENIAADLDEKGKVTIEVCAENAPNLSKQIRWQLKNDQPVTELVDEYTSESEGER